ncbi:hypothetical protein IW248_003779 [Micromonospora ureilytica]|uniref:Uncharacterized protein n=1 Tax=Micromonospora ureilytica TaxID=709868 RepID=A0ABS0JLF2_9ACTN|nr:hypothetical protein [Micromonospora ureilytica]
MSQQTLGPPVGGRRRVHRTVDPLAEIQLDKPGG